MAVSRSKCGHSSVHCSLRTVHKILKRLSEKLSLAKKLWTVTVNSFFCALHHIFCIIFRIVSYPLMEMRHPGMLIVHCFNSNVDHSRPRNRHWAPNVSTGISLSAKSERKCGKVRTKPFLSVHTLCTWGPWSFLTLRQHNGSNTLMNKRNSRAN